MKLAARTRWTIILLMLVATVALMVFAPDAPEAPALPVAARSPLATESNAATASIDAIRPRTRPGAEQAALFPAAPKPSAPPPKAAPKPVAPVEPAPLPQAPPVPFTAIGRLDDGSTPKVFVKYGERDLVLTPGARIDDTYSVESIKGGVVTVVYLPLNQRQSFALGDR